MLKRFGVSVVLLGLLAAGAVAAFAMAAPTGSAGPQTTRKHAAVVKINVVATEFKFAMSKRQVPVGSTVVFTVVNKGKISHDFKIAGQKTKTLNPGQKQTLKAIKFSKKGKFPYLCTLLGHAAAGMKGTFGVGVTPPPPPAPTTTPTTSTTPAPPPPTGPVGSAQTTVNVDMFEYRFAMSQSTIPSGQVTFVIRNRGSETHNFTINGVKTGTIIAPGAQEQWTVALPAGTYNTVCDVPFHAERGMVGSFTVTP
jgi:plastocyanin